MLPVDWTRLWETGPEKPQSWLRELVRRRIALLKWKSSIAKGGGSALMSSPVSLNDLFHPATFINALRQLSARKLSVAIDQVKLICGWDHESQRVRNDCPLPCTISSLLLQGACYSGTLQESAPEGSELIPVPEVTIGFAKISARDIYPSDQAVAVPVYLSPSREDFLMELQMPMPHNREHNRWVLTGLALFLADD